MAARILIIDDDRASAQLMARLLSEAGHTPLPARDAAAGVRAARAQLPDLVVCDIELPRAGRAAAAFKRDPALAPVPLLALAGARLAGAVREAFALQRARERL